MKNITTLFFLTLFTLSFGQQKGTLEDGTKIIAYEDKTWLYESEVNRASLTEPDTSIIIIDLWKGSSIYKNPNNSGSIIVTFPEVNLEVLDYIDGFYMVRSSEGLIGYTSEASLYVGSGFKEIIISKIVSNANSKGQNLLIKNIKVEKINSASGVDFSIEWLYTASKKTIKYIYFTVVPYNRVGDIQTCNISGHSTFTGKITGPITSNSPHQTPYWSTAWYNNTISCIKLTKVRVEYMDGSNYTYIKELNKILSEIFNNTCPTPSHATMVST